MIPVIFPRLEVRGSYRKQWAHLSYNETKVYVQKQMMLVKSRHLLLLFYKLSITIYAFLPALQNLKDAIQLLATSFARLPGLPRPCHNGDLSGYLSRSRLSGSLRGPYPDCRVDG